MFKWLKSLYKERTVADVLQSLTDEQVACLNHILMIDEGDIEGVEMLQRYLNSRIKQINRR